MATDLFDCDWYWGDLDWKWAERLLILCPDGHFLIRDSRSATYLFTVSYHYQGKVYHARLSLEDSRRNFGSQQPYHGPYVSRYFEQLMRTIQRSLQETREGQQEILHFRRGHEAEAARVHLTQPLTKRELLPSLQYLCRFVIRKFPRIPVIEAKAPPHILRYIEDPKWIIPDLPACEEQLKRRVFE